jgi:hypothetical protein
MMFAAYVDETVAQRAVVGPPDRSEELPEEVALRSEYHESYQIQFVHMLGSF